MTPSKKMVGAFHMLTVLTLLQHWTFFVTLKQLEKCNFRVFFLSEF